MCGSRTFVDRVTVAEVLQGIYEIHTLGWLTLHASPLTIITGEAKGADRLAREWAKTPGPHPADTEKDNPDICSVLYEGYPAKWNEHHPEWCPGDFCKARNFCMAAGPRRNQQMLDEADPTRVAAFIDKGLSTSRGTRDMVDRAEKAGLPVAVIRTRG